MREKQTRGLLHIPVLVVCLVIALYGEAFLVRSLKQSALEKASVFARMRLTSIEQMLTRYANAVESMDVTIRLDNGDVQDFPRLASNVMDGNPAISCVSLAPSGTVAYVWPKDQTESLGLQLLLDPRYRAECVLAKDTKQIVVAGPIATEGGGKVLVIRKPVFLSSRFWGFANAALDVDAVVSDSLASLPVAYQLTTELGGKEVPVSGKGEPGDAVEVTERMYGKEWTLKVEPGLSSLEKQLLVLVFVLMAGVAFLLSILAQAVLRLRSENIRLESSSNTDPLTGLLNRSGFQKAVFRWMHRHGYVRSVLVAIDVDRFKLVNDLYGQEAGDAVLVSFAKEMEKAFPDALIAREGGDEFLMLLCDPDDKEVRRAGAFFARAFTVAYEGSSHGYRVSAGWSEYPEQAISYSLLRNQADIALYHAKLSTGSVFPRYDSTMESDWRLPMGFSLKDLANGLPTGVLVFKEGEDWDILFANKRALALFGCEDLKEFLIMAGGSFKGLVAPGRFGDVDLAIRRQLGQKTVGPALVLFPAIGKAHGELELGLVCGRTESEHYDRVVFAILDPWDAMERLHEQYR